MVQKSNTEGTQAKESVGGVVAFFTAQMGKQQLHVVVVVVFLTGLKTS